jgi:hypothetical protein
MTLDRLDSFLATDLMPGDLDFGRKARFDPTAQIGALRAAIDSAPKTGRWKLRSRVGDRMVWYQEPEEVGHNR